MLERDVFAQALDKATDEERNRYLNEVCGEDAKLRGRIRALLEAEQRLGSFLEYPVSLLDATHDMPATPDKSGATIDSYLLLRKLGEGGFGVVYLARQTDPVQRDVALKLIKPGMDTHEVMARFEAERQALARMDHPYIAKVLDCGASEAGAPYFVMEAVDGVPITNYCDDNKLTTAERLALFVSVCRAIQHAHQKSVVHRDIKPANILVSTSDGTPVPKVIDFGIAKALDRQLSQSLKLTRIGGLVGTPLYMSPEQAGLSGLDVDSRTDVYSLGVLLYELLTGVTPFEKEQLEHVTYDEIRRVIRDEEPLRPSTRVRALGATATTVSERRQTAPKKLTALLRRDLDWIVMKALEKDRERRYETVDSFAADVLRYLNNEPVEAYPPSAAYRFGKLARRYRRSLTVAAAALVLIVAGAGFSLRQAVLASRAEQVARYEAATTEAVLEFINRDLLAATHPFEEPDRNLTVRVALDRAAARIEGRFDEQPRVEAAIRHAIGTSYLALGEYSAAESHLRKALKLRQEQLGENDRKTLASATHLAITLRERARYAEAEELQTATLSRQRRTLGPRHPDTLAGMMNLAGVVCEQGRFSEAERMNEELVKLQKQVLGEEHPATLGTLMNLAMITRALGHLEDSEKLCRELLDVQQRVLRDEHPNTLGTMNTLANALFAQGEHAAAEALHRRVLEIRRRVLGEEHPDTLSTLNNLALCLAKQARYEEAEKLRKQLLEIQIRSLGADHPDTLRNRMNLANLLELRGDSAAAEEMQREVHESYIRVLGEEHPDTLASRLNWINAINSQGRRAEAEREYRELLEIQIGVRGARHPETLKTMMNLAVAIHKQRRYGEAEELRRRVLELHTKTLGAEHPDTLANHLNLANAIWADGRHAEAEAIYQAVAAAMGRVLGPRHPHTLKCRAALARTLLARNQFELAGQLMDEVLDAQRQVLGSTHPDTQYSIQSLAWFLVLTAPEAIRNPTRALALAQELTAAQPDNRRYARLLAQAHYRSGDFASAEDVLRASLGSERPTHYDLLTLALVHCQMGRLDAARQIYDLLLTRPPKAQRDLQLLDELEGMMGI